ncbi:2-hydroxychromene-2-carboxylate isomerase [Dyella flagellata]|uniref:2-hydroxychromene-2-carboxylate isomerase n=1 Tax=Dyella flagellata TaxID=1867833 RepID=A0ABQ5XFG1_9GAMM|nr:2-hydroxychromene-2-carboxylate isomerase [Dyella flagellata]GLQ89265.1 isomerase [Dyella flagellata]
MTTTPVTFYFDPVSPYAWLAMEQVDRIAAAGGRIICRPILFAALLNAHGTKGPAEILAKRSYVFRDVMRQAKQLGLSFRGPPNHPFNPLAALRVMHAAENETQRLELSRVLLATAWRDGIDLADPVSLHAALECNGFDSDALSAAATTPVVKQRLRDTTQEALDAGVFGVPTFRLGDELFWGADRIDALMWALQGGDIDEDLYREVLARPMAAQRDNRTT